MDNENRKSSSYTNDLPSPIMPRRRLSAPETIMRKHLLAQQRSSSQDTSDSKSCGLSSEAASSDPYLNKKRDSSVMRKSTLIRRLWSHTKPLGKLSGSFHEWQYSCGKVSAGKSTQSNHSSPEHFSKARLSPNNKFSQSPKRMSPKHSSCVQNTTNSSPKRKIYSGNFESYYRSDSRDTIKPKHKGSESDVCSEGSTSTTKYTYSSFTTYSDSAYSQSISKNSQSSNNNITSSTSEITKRIAEDTENANLDGNIPSSIINNNITQTKSAETESNCSTFRSSIHESSTQTSDITNLNVISNVKLSKSTLDVIFNQVMQDLHQPTQDIVSINTATIATLPTTENNDILSVEKVPSFFLNTDRSANDNSERFRIDQFIISNVATASPYCKPTETPQVVIPRLAALPRTSSMEVNTSNGDSEDKESDSISLVDSLEDFNSPRIRNYDEKPIRGLDITQLLPENNEKRKDKSKNSTLFFIPIKLDEPPEMKSVSELLPDRVKEKLTKRQQKREERNRKSKNKISVSRSDSNYVSASENGNLSHVIGENESDVVLNNASSCSSSVKSITQRRKQHFLPSIDLKANKPNQRRGNQKDRKQNPIKRQEDLEYIVTKKKQTALTSKYKRKVPEVLSPIYVENKQSLNQKSETSKRIEILQIMECIDPLHRTGCQSREKSKIPVPVQVQTQAVHQKPTFLEFENVTAEPKLDRLIANILIDAMNNEFQSYNSNKENICCEKDLHAPSTSTKNPKYPQKFEAIPEEISTEVVNTNNNEQQTITNVSGARNGDNIANNNFEPTKIQEKNSSSVPKGWISFYTLHKDDDTPESTSDEGKRKILKDPSGEQMHLQETQNKDVQVNNCLHKFTKQDDENNPAGVLSPTNSEQQTSPGCNPSTARYKQHSSFPRKPKINSSYPGEWSITVSGTNTYGEYAPDVEMRLSFPNPLRNVNEITTSNTNHSYLEEERVSFPKIQNTPQTRSSIDRRRNERGREDFNQSLPRISNNPKRNNSMSSLYNNVFVPRQTKTSTCRYQLTRPRERYSLPDVNSKITERQYSEILHKFPELLTVAGRSISPERKPGLLSTSENNF